jgi:glycosyltransferase involved in cell wall biosynthesis
MRIGIDIKALSNNSTGIARYLKAYLDQLQHIDLQNEYVLFECNDSGYSLQNPKWKKLRTTWFLPGVLWQQMILPFLLKKHSVDVFWAPEQICPCFFMNTINIVTSVHDCVAVHYPQTSQWSVNTINKFLFKRTLRKSRFIVTVSDFIKRDLSTSFSQIIPREKLFAILNGKPIWEPPYNYDEAHREQFLFFVGNTEPRKNLLNLVRAIEILSNEGLAVDLHIAGPKGWKNKEFFNYCKKSPVRNRIHSIGFCTDDELKNNYLKCKALIFPSIYEGFGLPVLEALCLDSLVLSSRGTVMEEIAGPAALYFNPNDPIDIARTIRSIYSSNFNRTAVMQYKTEVLKKYSWNSSAINLLEVLKKCSIPL